jgi:HSP20 family molecular chaperone IbpA
MESKVKLSLNFFLKFVVELFVVTLFIFSAVAYAQSDDQFQSDREKMMAEFMKSRKRMMDTMLDAFGEDEFFKEGMEDDFFKSILGDRFKKLDSGFGNQKSLISINQVRNKDGSIEVFIKPKDESVQLDIETKDEAIVVKGKHMEKIENKNNGHVSTSMSQSSFSNSIRIPFGYKAGEPEAIKDQIKIVLSPNRVNPAGKVPVGKRNGENTL